MKLEDQCVSLDLAKRLKELGVKQSSIFVWSEIETVPSGREFRFYYCGNMVENNRLDCSAFTVAELGELLPDNCYTQKDNAQLEVSWLCHRIIDENQEDVWIAETEADARAKMLIYFLENGIIKND